MKTALVLLSVCILMVLLLGGLRVYLTYQTMKDRIMTSDLQDARLLSGYFGGFIHDVAGGDSVEAGSPDTIRAIKQGDKGQLRLIGDNLALTPGINVTIILDDHGNVLYNSLGANTTEFVSLGYYDAALKKNDTYVTNLYYSKILQSYVVSIAVPVRSNGSIISLIVSSVNSSTISNMLEGQRIDPTLTLFIVDGHGVVVASDVTSGIPANSNLPFVNVAHDLENGGEGVVETTKTYGGQANIVGFSPVPMSGWDAIVSTPTDIIYAQIFKNLVYILGLLLGLLGLLLIASYFLSGYLTKPVVELSNTMQKVSFGDYNVRAKTGGRDEIGDLSRTFNLMMDGLERNAELERVVELTKRYRLILQGARDPIFFVELDGRIIDVNDAAVQTYGYTNDELCSMDIVDLWILEERSKIKDQFQLCCLEGCVYETVHKRRDGSTFPVEISCSSTVIENRDVIVDIIRDITERKQAEEALEKAKNRAEMFLDLMGHDINNMNQVAMGFQGMALETFQHSDNERELLENVMKSLTNSALLIDNVRKIQKVESGEIKNQKMDLCAVLHEVKTEYSHVPNRQVTINCTPRPECNIVANELLKDVFSNLLGNAIKHSNPEKHLTVNMSVDDVMEKGKPYYKVIIEDDGPGIPDQLKNKLFQRFQRGKTIVSGKGLGLYIVRMLVEDFNGGVWVEDRVPDDYTKGAKFVVMLPAME
ncbi:MAG TPA: PAS domain S-box protein [Methanocella sp.]|nr:PAS domain S-box protein [Methanocella sp.]